MTGASPWHRKIAEKNQRRIFRLVAQSEPRGATVSDLVKKTRLSKPTILKHVKKMQRPEAEYLIVRRQSHISGSLFDKELRLIYDSCPSRFKKPGREWFDELQRKERDLLERSDRSLQEIAGRYGDASRFFASPEGKNWLEKLKQDHDALYASARKSNRWFDWVTRQRRQIQQKGRVSKKEDQILLKHLGKMIDRYIHKQRRRLSRLRKPGRPVGPAFFIGHRLEEAESGTVRII